MFQKPILLAAILIVSACAHSPKPDPAAMMEKGHYYVVPTDSDDLTGAITDVEKVEVKKTKDKMTLKFLSPIELSGPFQQEASFTGKQDEIGFYNLKSKVGQARCLGQKQKLICLISYVDFGIDEKVIDPHILKKHSNPKLAQKYILAKNHFFNEPIGILVVDMEQLEETVVPMKVKK